MPPIISVKDLTKSYGSNTVLDEISFEFQPGQIIGLLGPNGCGKTTLIKTLTGLIKDYSGQVLVDGRYPGPTTKALVAFMPDKSFVPNWMNVLQAIDYFTDFYSDFDKEKALNLAEKFNLPKKQKMKAMSKGMQEKFMLLLVMSRNAKLYVLDEPLGGVDPAARAFILDFIMANRAENSTIMLSTHLINDVERIFDSVLMIDHGKIVVNTSVDEIKKDGRTVEDVFKEVFGYAWQIN